MDPVIKAVIDNIIVPLVTLLFAAALFLFLWGLVKFVWKGSAEEERSKGKQHMIWGSVGMAIMISAFGIVQFIFNTVTDGGTMKGIDGKPIERPTIIDKGF